MQDIPSPRQGKQSQIASPVGYPDPRMAEEQLRALYQNPDYAIFTLDPDGYIKTWNTGAVRMKQYTAEEAIGQHFSILYPEDGKQHNEPMHNLEIAVKTGEYRAVGERQRKSGEIFLADVLITPIFHDKKLIGFSKIVADVTDQGHIRHERDKSRVEVKNLQVQQELRERFVSTLTHDLKNPLTTIKAAVEYLSSHTENNTPNRRMAMLAIRNLERLEGMITDLLDANRISAGEMMPLYPEQCDLSEIVHQTVADLQVTYGDLIQFKSEAPVIGFWDKAALKRVVENLLLNAVKYGDATKSLSIRIVEEGNRALLVVHNYGEPISPDEQKILFDTYQRTKAAVEGPKKGWGLGLTLVRGITEAHHGTVAVESTPDKGTTFTVVLPKNYRAPKDDLH